jgi:cystathionine beta-lyase
MSINHGTWDAINAERLREVASVKWSFPGATRQDVLGAWVAEMDFGTAPSVLAAWQRSAENAEFGYPPQHIVDEMTRATADWYAERYGWAVDPADIAPIADVIKGLELAIVEFSAPGTPVVVPTPAYMPFLSVPEALGRPVIQVPMLKDEAGGYSLDLEAIDSRLAAGAGLVILANPGNPTGKVFSREELIALATVVDGHGARVFSDEIHAPLALFGNQHVPLASVSEAGARVAITATSASKAWNLPGLKCAQIILSDDRDREIWQRIGMMASHGASTPGIRANTAAYREGGDWLDEVVGYLEGNAVFLKEALAAELPLARMTPLEGTYLSWIDVSAYPVGGDIAAYLLEHAGVMVNAGPAFGLAGEGYLRMNIATSRGILSEIIERTAAALTPA